jgi:undecaprenyl diphosphate synthase
MKEYARLIDRDRVPRHVAIIMDGNGRWAKKRSLPRVEGHRRGAQVIESLMDTAIGLGIGVVSLYAFSTENWSRPKDEIAGIWRLLEMFFEANIEKIKKKGVRLRHSGSMRHLPASTRRIIEDSVGQTRNNRIITLNFCLNYGGRQELLDAVNGWAASRKHGEKLSERSLERHLYTSGLPDVDLLIRTSGEHRISNFLLWQVAYAEMIFTRVLWPDFKPRHLYRMIYEYQQRDRRFGGL